MSRSKRAVGLLLALSLVFGMAAGVTLAADATVSISINATRMYDMAAQVVALVNQERANAGLDPVAMDSVLQEAAMQRAAELDVLFSHTRPDGSAYYTAVEGGMRFTGAENVATGETAADAMDYWMNSEDGHREQILKPAFTSIGVGMVSVDGAYYWVQLFDGGTARPEIITGDVVTTASIDVPADDITLSNLSSVSISLDAGGTEELSSFRGANMVTTFDVPVSSLSVSSNNDSVATAAIVGNQIVITAVGGGTADITVSVTGATTAKGSIVYSVSVSAGAPTVGAVTVPTAVTEGNALELTTPDVSANGAEITAQGWEISANGSDPWDAFDPATPVTVADHNEHYLRYYATNSEGTSYSSNTVQITVNEAPPAGAPIIEDITAPADVTEGNALELTTPDVDANYAEVTAQGWQISANGSDPWDAFNPAMPVTVADHNEHYLRYYATNSEGTSYSSNTVQITVNEAPPAGAPIIEDITAPADVTEGNALELTTPGVDANYAEVTAQGWEISANGNDSWEAFDPATNVTVAEHDGYYLRYYATNSEGTSYSSNTVQITVNEAPPVAGAPIIEDITAPATVTEENTLELTTPDVSANGAEITAQGWQISANGNDSWEVFDTATPVTVADHNGYYLRYYATNSEGTSYSSNTVQITVNEAPPVAGAPIIEDITAPATVTEGNTLELTTPGVDANYAEVTDQGWEISANGNDSWVAFNPATDVTVADHDEYYLRYYATNSVDTSYSNIVQITVYPVGSTPWYYFGSGALTGSGAFSRTLHNSQYDVSVTGRGISGSLVVRPGSLHAAGQCTACDEMREYLDADQILLLYDISISGSAHNDVEVSIYVGSEYEGELITILHCKDGAIERVTTTVQDGYVTGAFNGLSPFAVLRPSTALNILPPKTGEAENAQGAVIAILCLMALAGGVLLRRRAVK